MPVPVAYTVFTTIHLQCIMNISSISNRVAYTPSRWYGCVLIFPVYGALLFRSVFVCSIFIIYGPPTGFELLSKYVYSMSASWDWHWSSWTEAASLIEITLKHLFLRTPLDGSFCMEFQSFFFLSRHLKFNITIDATVFILLVSCWCRVKTIEKVHAKVSWVVTFSARLW